MGLSLTLNKPPFFLITLLFLPLNVSSICLKTAFIWTLNFGFLFSSNFLTGFHFCAITVKLLDPRRSPDIWVRCCTAGSFRWPPRCEVGYCRPSSSPSSGRRCPAGPRSPGTASPPALWRCLSRPRCPGALPTRSPRRAGLQWSQFCPAPRPYSGLWGCGAEWSRSSSRKRCGSSRGSSGRVGKP